MRRHLGGGNNGSIRLHSSSSMMGLPISLTPSASMAQVNSLPVKSTTPSGSFFGTVLIISRALFQQSLLARRHRLKQRRQVQVRFNQRREQLGFFLFDVVRNVIH